MNATNQLDEEAFTSIKNCDTKHDLSYMQQITLGDEESWV